MGFLVGEHSQFFGILHISSTAKAKAKKFKVVTQLGRMAKAHQKKKTV